MGDPWYRIPARYVRPHPAQSTTPASPLKHPFDTPYSSTSLACKNELEVDLCGILVMFLLRLRRYRLSTDNNLNSLGEVRVRSQEFAFWELEESLNNEN